jgi:apolipoprotein N-acyltransferase
VIDGFGRVRASLDQGETNVIITTLPPPQPETLFSRLGLYVVMVVALLAGFGALIIDRQKPPPLPRPFRTI